MDIWTEGALFKWLGSAATTKSLPDAMKRQFVLDQMAKDPTGMVVGGSKSLPSLRQGPRIIKVHDTGEMISRYHFLSSKLTIRLVTGSQKQCMNLTLKHSLVVRQLLR